MDSILVLFSIFQSHKAHIKTHIFYRSANYLILLASIVIVFRLKFLPYQTHFYADNFTARKSQGVNDLISEL